MSRRQRSGLRIVVVSMWPSRETPERGIFVRRQVDALERLGHDVHVVRFTDARTGTLRTPLKYILLLWRARRMVRRVRPDVVHGHFLVPTGSITRLAARRYGVPYVVTAHGTDVRNAEQSASLRARTGTVVRDAAAVIAVSDALAARLQALYEDAAPDVSDMGVDTRVFAPAADPDRAPAAATPTGGPRLVAVASLLPNKNQEALLRAIATTPAARVVLIGDGPDHARLEALVADLGLRERVALRGRAPYTELADWYRRMDAACLVSLDEGFGLTALEALACGCPVVVSATAPVAALVEHGVTGAVVDPTDIVDIARGIELAGTLGQLDPAQVAAVVAGRSVDDQAARVAAVLTRVVARSGG